MRPALRPVARSATRAFARKYELRLDEAAAHEGAVRAALDRLRSSLAERPLYLQGAFSYADIAMATLLQLVSPVDDRFWRIGPATRATWTRHSLATGYADLVSWRDRLYETHRLPAGPAS